MEATQRTTGGTLLCHVTTRAVLDAAGPLLTDRPFLHCCTEAQLPFVLSRHFAGQEHVLILRFAPEDIHGRIEWERSEPDQAPFPHLFGAIPVTAALISTLKNDVKD